MLPNLGLLLSILTGEAVKEVNAEETAEEIVEEDANSIAKIKSDI